MNSLIYDLLQQDKSIRAALHTESPKCVNVTDVTREYIEQHNGTTDFYEDIMHNLPALSPPFDNMWMEYTHDTPHGVDISVGTHAISNRLPALVNAPTWSPFAQEIHRTACQEFKRNFKDVQAGWVVTHEVYVRITGGRVNLFGAVVWFLDGMGRFLDYTHISAHEVITRETLIGLMPIGFALSLMHCKNVVTEDVIVPPAVAKKRAKRGIPALTFKTLTVKPVGKKVTQAHNSEPSGTHNRLHICRGHFKDYREKPLFGKAAGIYWWADHVRGDAKAGAVVKGYKVKPNSGAENG